MPSAPRWSLWFVVLHCIVGRVQWAVPPRWSGACSLIRQMIEAVILIVTDVTKCPERSNKCIHMCTGSVRADRKVQWRQRMGQDKLIWRDVRCRMEAEGHCSGKCGWAISKGGSAKQRYKSLETTHGLMTRHVGVAEACGVCVWGGSWVRRESVLTRFTSWRFTYVPLDVTSFFSEASFLTSFVDITLFPSLQSLSSPRISFLFFRAVLRTGNYLSTLKFNF